MASICSCLSKIFILALLLANTHLCAALYPTELLYEFPIGTVVENLAVRSDGSILTTLATAPELYLIQPSSTNPNPQLIHRFDGSTSVLGITELSPDSFIVAVSSVSGGSLPAPVPGSSSLWTVSFPKKSNAAKVSLAAPIPDVLAPNGLITLNKQKILLSDSAKGLIFVVDLKTGISSIAISDPLLATNERLPVGVNGIKLRGHTLYFTNSAQKILGKIDIDLKTGAARGPATIIAHSLPNPPDLGYDDFAISNKGVAFVANGPGNFIERVDLKSGQQSIVAGEVNSTEIAEPTAAALGRNGREDTLFVTTAGGLLFPVNGDEVVGGQVVAVQLGKKY